MSSNSNSASSTLDKIVQVKGTMSMIYYVAIGFLIGLPLIVIGAINVKKDDDTTSQPTDGTVKPQLTITKKTAWILIGSGIAIILIAVGIAYFAFKSPNARRVAGVF